MTNQVFWNAKLDGNIERDKRQQQQLRVEGWSVLIVWECELREELTLAGKINSFLIEQRPPS